LTTVAFLEKAAIASRGKNPSEAHP